MFRFRAAANMKRCRGSAQVCQQQQGSTEVQMYRCRAGKVHRCRGAEDRVQKWCRAAEVGAGAERCRAVQSGAEVQRCRGGADMQK